MPVYFLRHGESKANVDGVFAGQKEDSPLTEKGEQQAKQAARELQGKKISKVYVSPLKRAQQTARLVTEAAQLTGLSVVTDARLAEYDMGTLTGMPIRAITSYELVTAPGAEDADQFKERVLSFLREHKHEDILIVSHAGVGRMIEAVRLDLNPQEFYSVPPYSNGHVMELALDWLDDNNE